MRNALMLLVLSGCSAYVGTAPPETEDADVVVDASDAAPIEVVDAGHDASDATPATKPLTGTFTIGTTLETTDDADLVEGTTTLETIPGSSVVSIVNQGSPKNGAYNVLHGTKVGWVSGAFLEIAKPPAAHTLSTKVVSQIIEPLGSGTDSAGNAYTDKNYWNFCAPGAVTAALSFFGSHATTWPAAHFEEPYGPYRLSTYWDDTHSRAYLMHIAEAVSPPTFTNAGLPGFSTYPTHGSSLGDSRDVLNWEASNHASTWKTFFYQSVSSTASSTTLHADVRRDIWGGHAIVAMVDTAYLPNWSRSLGHAIAIVGYDDAASTYTFVDTCGKACNGSAQAQNGGVNLISQSKMHTAISAFGVGYAR